MTDAINYGHLMQQAMRGLMISVLNRVERDGLPGEHHFFITFDTSFEGVEIADWLRERYPDDMTIVIQHWFENLEIFEDRFNITLNFGDAPEPMVIPFDSIKTFVDPSVEFGLRFEEADEDNQEDAAFEDESPMLDEVEAEEKPKVEAEIVSLDSFR